MIRSPMVRLLALAFAGTASLAAPTAALAHGYAHSEAAEHAKHHSSDPAHESEYLAVGAPDHDEDHSHTRLDPSALARAVKDVPALHCEAAKVAIADVVCRDTTAAPAPNESPPERPGTAPPQSRAPPAL